MPRSTAQGTNSAATSSGVLPMAICTPSKASGRSTSTSRSAPATVKGLPAERGEASSLMRRAGNCRSRSDSTMMRPTAPVAPTTAMVSIMEG